MKDSKLKVFSGNAHPVLARRICEYLNIPLGKIHASRFQDGELDIKVNEDVRGRDVFIVQPTCPPVNENLMELLVIIDCMRRASADRITAVIPYYGYARKDRKDEGRVPITAKLVANLITIAGAGRVLAMDLHANQIQGFFDIPVDHLFAAPIFVDYYRRKNIQNLCIASPDVGGTKVARAYAKALRADLVIVDKRRIAPDKPEVVNIIGDVKGKNVLIVDDIIATGGTVSEATVALLEHGAKEVYLCATHPVLCGQALTRLSTCGLKEVCVSDTIPIDGKEIPLIKVLSVAPLLGEAIRRIHLGESVSSLFLMT